VAVRDMVGRWNGWGCGGGRGRSAKECARRYGYDSSDDRSLRSCLRLVVASEQVERMAEGVVGGKWRVAGGGAEAMPITL
jgi:hypothetical protein